MRQKSRVAKERSNPTRAVAEHVHKLAFLFATFWKTVVHNCNRICCLFRSCVEHLRNESTSKQRDLNYWIGIF